MDAIPYEPGELRDCLRKHAGSWSAGLRIDDLDDVTVLLVWRWWQAGQ